MAANRHKVFFAGWACSILVNTGLTMVAYNFASVALIAPFGGVHIAFNVVLAHFVNAEPLGWSDLANTLTILSGLVTVLVIGPKDEPAYTLQTLWGFYRDVPCLIFASALGALIITLHATRQAERLCQAVDPELSKEARERRAVGLKAARRTATAGLAGCFACFSNLSIKLVIEIMSAAGNGEPVCERAPQTHTHPAAPAQPPRPPAARFCGGDSSADCGRPQSATGTPTSSPEWRSSLRPTNSTG